MEFTREPSEFDLNYLLLFCEYTFNFVRYVPDTYLDVNDVKSMFMRQFHKLVELIGYKLIAQDVIYILVPDDQVVMAVAEIIDKSLSYRVMEYNHYSMKGDLDKKRSVLLALADKIDSLRKSLKQRNPKLEDCLYFLFNSVDIRHNNSDKGSKDYKFFTSQMDKDTVEYWYDETYQICLLAFLELDNIDRMSNIEELKKNY